MKYRILIAVIVLLMLSSPTFAVQYTITDLGVTPYHPWSATTSGANGINDAGQIAGYKLTTAGNWYPGPEPTAMIFPDTTDPFPFPPGRENRFGDNSRGYAMGIPSGGNTYVMVGTLGGKPVMWDDAGTHVLNGPGGTSYTGAAESINASGDIVGYIHCLTANPTLGLLAGDNPCLWRDGVCTMLGAGWGTGRAHSINDAGQIVGNLGSLVLWWTVSNSVVTSHPLAMGSTARDINTSGTIVGYRPISDHTEALVFAYHSLKWLGVLPGYLSSYACGINDSGLVVGYCDYGRLASQGFVYDGTQMTGLGGLVAGGNSWAYGINSQGWIVGTAVNAYGTEHAVLWTPVPEPSSLLALAFGLAGIGGVIRRRTGAFCC